MHNKLKNLYRITTLSLLVLLGGCGVKTIYHQLDWYIPSVIEDFISLSDKQQSVLSLQVKQLLAWHRQTQLPVYATTLRTIRSQIKQGLNETHIEQISAELENYWKIVTAKMAPDMADLLLTTTASQQEELRKNFIAKNREYEEEYIRINEIKRREKIVEDLSNNLKRWLGPLTDQQIKLISYEVTRYEQVHVDRLAYRKHWQEKLLTTLQDSDKTRAREMLISLFSEPRKHRSDIFNKKLDTNKELNKALFLKINRMLTSEQLQHLSDEIEYYAKSFDELAMEKG